MPSGKKSSNKIKKPNLTSNACKHYYEEQLLDGIRKIKAEEEENENVMRRFIDSMVDDARKQKSNFYLFTLNTKIINIKKCTINYTQYFICFKVFLS